MSGYQENLRMLKEAADSDARARERNKHSEEFKTFDRRELSRMGDKALAEWQARHSLDEPQHRLAEHEWQRRISVEEIKAVMKSAWIQGAFAVFGAIVGGIVGWALASITHH